MKTIKKVKGFLSKWNELILIPLAILLWSFSAPFLRLFDETAAAYDAGIYQIILFAIIQMFVLHSIVRIIMRLQWPSLDNYLANLFNDDFEVHRNLTPYQKICVSLFVFFLLLFALVLLSRVL